MTAIPISISLGMISNGLTVTKLKEVGAFAPGFNLPAVTPQIQTRKSSRHIDHKENKGNLTPAYKYVKSVQEGHGSRKFKRWLGSTPMDKTLKNS